MQANGQIRQNSNLRHITMLSCRLPNLQYNWANNRQHSFDDSYATKYWNSRISWTIKNLHIIGRRGY
jgi:hypothetical protein